ncbi:MAG TPA: ATP-binding protein [Burkholderiales bacterium]
MTLRRVPLRRRLLWLAAAGIVPLAVISGIGLAALVHQQRVQAERAGIEITRALSTAVDAELQRSISVLEALASAPSLERGDLRAFREAVQRMMQNNAGWLTVILADRSGRQVFNTRFPLGSELPMIIERDSFEAILQLQRPVIGNLARGPGTQPAVAVRVPVWRNGEMQYVLTAAVKPDGILEVINRQRVPPDWVVSVFDAKNMRVARSRQHREYLGSAPAPSLLALMERQGPEGSGVTYALEGNAVYTAYSRSAETGWTVAIGVPPSFVEASAVRSLAVFGGGLILSLVLAVLAALAVGRSITRPMDRLRSAAQALGRREALELPQTPITEIRQVADSLAVAADERTRGEAEREQLLEREQQARAIAEAANRSKDEFLAMLGHELRNPVGAISNAAQLLGAADEEARAHARAVIGRQVQHLARMTDDLLDAARAMTGKIVLHRQPLDLAEAAARSVSTLRAASRSASRRVVQQLEPAWVEADPTRIEQIIGNLLGNALKFTREDGTITVSVSREGSDAVLRVIDDGLGMPGDLATRAFDPFVQGERPLDRSHGGLGIGLTLVRRLAELHGGSAQAHSEGADRGSAFTIRLPSIMAPLKSGAEPVREAPIRSRDVLIVEDSEDARETLRRLLELQGHRVRTAADGAQGLEAMRAAPPEIALVDLGLPGMDGYELARRVHAEIDPTRRPFLVALTGYGLPEDRSRTRAAGFDLHLVKPVDAAQLAELLGK